ncbi:exonuclease [Sparassis crispa]|uniref:Exonuclease n=1 Tax=Sparassis crispa TaxID=139825 RepID=A0A401G7T7_9APHY|nr:exonuclease [Sparassis crispa]GBE78213.1 exonuclease [Sparassis crispa]
MKLNDLFENPTSCAFLTCGNWDLQTMLPEQLALRGFDASCDLVPPYNRWINVKKAFRKYYGMKHPPGGMLQMLQKLDLELEGRHHSGIDDCRNILRIVRKMRMDGWRPAGDLTRW